MTAVNIAVEVIIEVAFGVIFRPLKTPIGVPTKKPSDPITIAILIENTLESLGGILIYIHNCVAYRLAVGRFCPDHAIVEYVTIEHPLKIPMLLVIHFDKPVVNINVNIGDADLDLIVAVGCGRNVAEYKLGNQIAVQIIQEIINIPCPLLKFILIL